MAIVWVGLQVLSFLLRPKMAEQAKVTPGELEGTLVDSSSDVPVLFGTRLLTKTNCVWYGDVGTTAIVNCSGGKK
ncbi:MAG: hypothetical protein J0652_02555 [Desulfobulbaceae bacterium]|nr:hypothetical protein [Desulfobulbaceae bacterium]